MNIHECVAVNIALYVSVAVSKTMGFGYNHTRVAGW